MLIHRLQEHALSPDEFIVDKKTKKRISVGPKIRMTDTQIRSAEILLKKMAPDLQRTTLVGDPDAPMQTITTTMTPKEAAEAYAATLRNKR